MFRWNKILLSSSLDTHNLSLLLLSLLKGSEGKSVVSASVAVSLLWASALVVVSSVVGGAAAGLWGNGASVSNSLELLRVVLSGALLAGVGSLAESTSLRLVDDDLSGDGEDLLSAAGEVLELLSVALVLLVLDSIRSLVDIWINVAVGALVGLGSSVLPGDGTLSVASVEISLIIVLVDDVSEVGVEWLDEFAGISLLWALDSASAVIRLLLSIATLIGVAVSFVKSEVVTLVSSLASGAAGWGWDLLNWLWLSLLLWLIEIESSEGESIVGGLGESLDLSPDQRSLGGGSEEESDDKWA